MLNYSIPDNKVLTGSFISNGEWDLTKADSFPELKISAFGARFPVVVLQLTLTRVPTYFIVNVLIPCIVITFLSISVYWLPYESGEKVSLGITVLLSFSIVMLMINDITPRSGDNMPVLCEYF